MLKFTTDIIPVIGVVLFLLSWILVYIAWKVVQSNFDKARMRVNVGKYATVNHNTPVHNNDELNSLLIMATAK